MADGWERVRSLPGLQAGELQVWRIDLAEAGDSAEVYQKFLSSEERERAERMRAGQVRMQFVIGRGCLRVLLGDLVGIEPKEVPIALSGYGKPQTPPAGGKSFYFNAAHSRDTVLIALCRQSQVGIDLEYFDRETDVLEIARRTFTVGEFRQIEAAGGPEQQRRAFFRCWTRKEAVAKADGRGLSLPLDSFQVPVLAEAEAVPIRIVEAGSGRGSKIADWYVSDLKLGEAMAGAFAVAVPELSLRMFIFPLRPMPDTSEKR